MSFLLGFKSNRNQKLKSLESPIQIQYHSDPGLKRFPDANFEDRSCVVLAQELRPSRGLTFLTRLLLPEQLGEEMNAELEEEIRSSMCDNPCHKLPPATGCTPEIRGIGRETIFPTPADCLLQEPF